MVLSNISKIPGKEYEIIGLVKGSAVRGTVKDILAKWQNFVGSEIKNYADMLNDMRYHRSNGQLDGEGMFYSTSADLEERTALTQRQQDRAVTHLEELGLICTKLKGMLARKYFKINPDTEMLMKLLREKPKKKDMKKADITTKKDSSDTDADSESDSGNPANEQPENTDENKSETSFDKTLKQGSTEAQTLFQQNVETSMYKTLKPDSTKSESMVQLCSRACFTASDRAVG